MNFEISSALLYFLAKELKKIEGGKVEKIYQVDNNVFFRFYKEKEKHDLRFVLPNAVCLSSQTFDAPKTPPNFCVFLRKYLSGSRLQELYQKDFERILIFKFLNKEKEYFLIAEFFKPGNIILCTEKESSLIIINSWSRQKFKDRAIQSRIAYEFPPALTNPLNITAEDLVSLTTSSDRNVVKTLATRLGFGGIYAEELLSKAKIDKEKKVLTLDDATKIVLEIETLFKTPLNPVKSGTNVYPFPMLTKKGESLPSLSEGIESFFPIEKKQKSEAIEKKKDKTTSLISIQEKMIKDLETQITENQEKGEFIYSNYQAFKILIEEANKIRKNKNLEALEAEMKKNPKFKSLNKKDKEITLKF